MNRLMLVRLFLAVIGVAVWGYGVFKDESNVRLAGIAMLAVSLVLRFAPKGSRSDTA